MLNIYYINNYWFWRMICDIHFLLFRDSCGNFLQGQYHFPLSGHLTITMKSLDGAILIIASNHCSIAWLIAVAPTCCTVFVIYKKEV